jgi:hypothetical protein
MKLNNPPAVSSATDSRWRRDVFAPSCPSQRGRARERAFRSGKSLGVLFLYLGVSATAQAHGGAHPEKMGTVHQHISRVRGSGLAQADGGAYPEKMSTSAGSGALPREICF